jgi:hypothetical protein
MRAPTGPGPLEASLLVEGLRARPSFFVAISLVAHAFVWTLTLWLADPTPHPKIAIGLALGREWQIGYADAPPLAPWLLEMAYNAGGIFAAYALGPLAVALAGWLVFAFARSVVGDRQGALATFLLVGVHPVAFPVGAFDSDLLQMPLIALAVLAWWRAVGERHRTSWFAFALALSGLAYAGIQGLFVLAALAGLTVANAAGRSVFRSHETLLAAVAALFVFTLFLTPRLIWLGAHGFAGVVQGVAGGVDPAALSGAYGLAFTAVLGHIGLIVLVALASRLAAPDRETAPGFVRPPLDRFGKAAAIVLALLPAVAAGVTAYVTGWRFPIDAAAPLVLYSGLLVVVLAETVIRIHRQRAVTVAALTLLFLPPALELANSLAAPLVGGGGRATNWPAREIARYVTDIFATRTGKPLAIVVGDARTASAIAIASATRPRAFLDVDPARAPWIDADALKAAGAVVVWPISGPDSAPPAGLVARLPPFTPEAPLSFNWLRSGGLDPVRLGWAIVPPER